MSVTVTPARVKPDVVLAADGACSGNPGPGGWGAILVCQGREDELSGFEPMTTNNQMELTAVLEGLKALRKPCRVTVLTDSQNVVGWLSLNWKRNDAKIRALVEQIEALARAVGHTLVFQKVPGHAGHALNERVDRLARRAVLRGQARVTGSIET